MSSAPFTRAARAISRMRQPIDSARSQSAGVNLADAANGKSSGRTHAPNARYARIDSFAAASMPERSASGSPSASPSACASATRLVERQLGLLEPRDDEVAGAVEDAREAVDLVGAVTQVTKDRQRRRGRRLAVERRRGALREHAEIGELRRQQRLVGGDHRLAGRERGAEDRLHRHAAGDLDDDVDIGIADQLERPIGERNVAARGPRSFVRSRTAIFETREVARR